MDYTLTANTALSYAFDTQLFWPAGILLRAVGCMPQAQLVVRGCVPLKHVLRVLSTVSQ